jgi:comEA protein
MDKQERRVLFLLVLLVAMAAAFRYWRYKKFAAESEAFLQKRDSLFYRYLNKADSLFLATKKQVKEGKSGIFTKKININKADEKELTKLPGIGPSLARRILDHRAVSGRFRSLEQLMEVKGIGSKKFGKIKPYIRLEEKPRINENKDR